MVDPDETARAACAREVEEEVGLDVRPVSFVGLYDAPGRDSRGNVSAAYLRLPTDDAKPEPPRPAGWGRSRPRSYRRSGSTRGDRRRRARGLSESAPGRGYPASVRSVVRLIRHHRRFHTRIRRLSGSFTRPAVPLIVPHSCRTDLGCSPPFASIPGRASRYTVGRTDVEPDCTPVRHAAPRRPVTGIATSRSRDRQYNRRPLRGRPPGRQVVPRGGFAPREM